MIGGTTPQAYGATIEVAINGNSNRDCRTCVGEGPATPPAGDSTGWTQLVRLQIKRQQNRRVSHVIWS